MANVGVSLLQCCCLRFPRRDVLIWINRIDGPALLQGASLGVRFSTGSWQTRPPAIPWKFGGILQTDGYTGYGKVGGQRVVHAGCWAHVRRYFFQAVHLNRKDLLDLLENSSWQ